MKTSPGRERIKVWRLPELKHLELYQGTGVSRSFPRHWHEEYHLCAVQAGAGELHYRGAHHATPAGSLCLVHPGEIHANCTSDAAGCTYRTLNAGPDLLRCAAMEAAGRAKAPPFFTTVVTFDEDIIQRFINLHKTLEASTSRLERESSLLSLFVHLILRYADDRPSLRPLGQEPQAVKRARDYLTDNYSENISLERLARIAYLSPFYLNRVFRREIGLPPHPFQTQVRIARAKAFLQQGWPLSQVAQATGFSDQSHFTRHFNRLVGVPPGQYLQNSKNVQDNGSAVD